ncbi:MAG: hypothetical protein JNK58_06610 [Phycisphaerae bacterium]|nr:hypothetical protein [Phycisphaerae bacterium]
MRIGVLPLFVVALLSALPLTARSASAAATPSQIADKAIAKMRAISAGAIKNLAKQERLALRPLRNAAERGAPVESRQVEVLKRAAKLGPIAEEACRKIVRERDRALGRLVALEGRGSEADIAAARSRLRAERDALHTLIGGRADTAADNLALAATLDPGDRDEVDSLTPNVPSPTCDVEAMGS